MSNVVSLDIRPYKNVYKRRNSLENAHKNENISNCYCMKMRVFLHMNDLFCFVFNWAHSHTQEKENVVNANNLFSFAFKFTNASIMVLRMGKHLEIIEIYNNFGWFQFISKMIVYIHQKERWPATKNKVIIIENNKNNQEEARKT